MNHSRRQPILDTNSYLARADEIVSAHATRPVETASLFGKRSNRPIGKYVVCIAIGPAEKRIRLVEQHFGPIWGTVKCQDLSSDARPDGLVGLAEVCFFALYPRTIQNPRTQARPRVVPTKAAT